MQTPQVQENHYQFW